MNVLLCPIDGCPNYRKSDHAFCSSHWFELPLKLREKIWKTRGSPDANRIAIVEAWDFINAKDAEADTARVPEIA